MSNAHDYYNHHADHPELHNRGEGMLYHDPDYSANGNDDQLPIISTIGRGPRGEGVVVESMDGDGVAGFRLVSTLTGETVYTSPNFLSLINSAVNTAISRLSN